LKKIEWKNTIFVKTAVEEKEYPMVKNDRGDPLPEAAVVGRSNVGKSTLLNSLFKTPLVRTSSTPGKTQHLNFFTVDKTLSFVDLPGYGFAKVPTQIRREWGPMILEYLNSRPSLQMILFLFDIRRTPAQEDLDLMEWIAKAGKGVILVLTKVDKVTENEKRKLTDQILKGFDVPGLHYLHFSAPKKIGREILVRMIHEAFSGEEE
jgi:GTP-binding protein